MTNENRIKVLEEQIRALRDEDKAEAAALRESVTPVWRYTLELTDRTFDKIFDPAVLTFRLSGTCTNKAACEEVGHKIDEGGMSYYYNTATGSFITSTGGGRLYLSNPWNRRSATDFEAQAMRDLSAFVGSHPKGGDVTHIVAAHAYAKECDHNGVFAPYESQGFVESVFCPTCEYDIAVEDL